MDDDDVDIYEDLPSFERQYCPVTKEITEKCSELEKVNAELKIKIEQLAGWKRVAEANLSSLMKTAKAEIARKDRMIARLRRELDDAAFRRGNSWKKSLDRSGYPECRQNLVGGNPRHNFVGAESLTRGNGRPCGTSESAPFLRRENVQTSFVDGEILRETVRKEQGAQFYGNIESELYIQRERIGNPFVGAKSLQDDTVFDNCSDDEESDTRIIGSRKEIPDTIFGKRLRKRIILEEEADRLREVEAERTKKEESDKIMDKNESEIGRKILGNAQQDGNEKSGKTMQQESRSIPKKEEINSLDQNVETVLPDRMIKHEKGIPDGEEARIGLSEKLESWQIDVNMRYKSEDNRIKKENNRQDNWTIPVEERVARNQTAPGSTSGGSSKSHNDDHKNLHRRVDKRRLLDNDGENGSNLGGKRKRLEEGRNRWEEPRFRNENDEKLENFGSRENGYSELGHKVMNYGQERSQNGEKSERIDDIRRKSSRPSHRSRSNEQRHNKERFDRHCRKDKIEAHNNKYGKPREDRQDWSQDERYKRKSEMADLRSKIESKVGGVHDCCNDDRVDKNWVSRMRKSRSPDKHRSRSSGRRSRSEKGRFTDKTRIVDTEKEPKDRPCSKTSIKKKKRTDREIISKKIIGKSSLRCTGRAEIEQRRESKSNSSETLINVKIQTVFDEKVRKYEDPKVNGSGSGSRDAGPVIPSCYLKTSIPCEKKSLNDQSIAGVSYERTVSKSDEESQKEENANIVGKSIDDDAEPEVFLDCSKTGITGREEIICWTENFEINGNTGKMEKNENIFLNEITNESSEPPSIEYSRSSDTALSRDVQHPRELSERGTWNEKEKKTSEIVVAVVKDTVTEGQVFPGERSNGPSEPGASGEPVSSENEIQTNEEIRERKDLKTAATLEALAAADSSNIDTRSEKTDAAMIPGSSRGEEMIVQGSIGTENLIKSVQEETHGFGDMGIVGVKAKQPDRRISIGSPSNEETNNEIVLNKSEIDIECDSQAEPRTVNESEAIEMESRSNAKLETRLVQADSRIGKYANDEKIFSTDVAMKKGVEELDVKQDMKTSIFVDTEPTKLDDAKSIVASLASGVKREAKPSSTGIMNDSPGNTEEKGISKSQNNEPGVNFIEAKVDKISSDCTKIVAIYSTGETEEQRDSRDDTSEILEKPVGTPGRLIAVLEYDSDVTLIPSLMSKTQHSGSRSFREEKIENIEKFIMDYRENEDPRLPVENAQSELPINNNSLSNNLPVSLERDSQDFSLDEKSENEVAKSDDVISKNESLQKSSNGTRLRIESRAIKRWKIDGESVELSTAKLLKSDDEISAPLEKSEIKPSTEKSSNDKTKQTKRRPRIPCMTVLSRVSRKRPSIFGDSVSACCTFESHSLMNNGIDDKFLREDTEGPRFPIVKLGISPMKNGRNDPGSRIEIQNELPESDKKMFTGKNSRVALCETMNATEINDKQNDSKCSSNTQKTRPELQGAARKSENSIKPSEPRETRSMLKILLEAMPENDNKLLPNRKRGLPKEGKDADIPAQLVDKHECRILVTARRRRPMKLEDSCTVTTLVPSDRPIRSSRGIVAETEKAQPPNIISSLSSMKAEKRRFDEQ